MMDRINRINRKRKKKEKEKEKEKEKAGCADLFFLLRQSC
jgi:hypothetical protein